jgi:hypothetical protein
MIRFYAICGALVVGILLVGPAHAGPPHSRQRSRPQSRHQSGRHWRALRPRPVLLPWQLLPEQPPGWWDNDPDSGPDDPNAGGFDPNTGTDDPNAAGSQPGEDVGGGKVARPAATPKAGSQRRMPKSSDNSPRNSGSGSPG